MCARAFDRFGLKTGGESHQEPVQEGLTGLASKSEGESGAAGWR